MIEKKIFISHSSKDVDYVKLFVENILELGLDVSSERIFCSSIGGNGVKSGEDILHRIKEEIGKSSLALLFVSKNYKESEICLNEVGALWATLSDDSVIPMLLPNISFSELGVLNLNKVGLKLYERSGISEFVQDCKEKLNPNFNLVKLNTKIENYLTEIEKLDKTKSDTKLENNSEKIEIVNSNIYNINYYVNKNTQPGGEHEVHQSTCSYLPDAENRIYLGVFSNCKDAIKEAKNHYDDVNGCYYCCNDCHTK